MGLLFAQKVSFKGQRLPIWNSSIAPGIANRMPRLMIAASHIGRQVYQQQCPPLKPDALDRRWSVLDKKCSARSKDLRTHSPNVGPFT
jgi:hypothetical protein